MNKTQFLDLLQSGHDQIAQLAEQAAAQHLELTPGVIGHWSIKEVIAHLIGSHRHVIKELEVIARDDKLTPVDTGFTGDNDSFNARSVALYADRPFDDVCADFDQTFGQILELSQNFIEEQLLRPFEDGSDELLWESIADNTFWHYDEHLGAMRTWLDQHTQ